MSVSASDKSMKSGSGYSFAMSGLMANQNIWSSHGGEFGCVVRDINDPRAPIPDHFAGIGPYSAEYDRIGVMWKLMDTEISNA